MAVRVDESKCTGCGSCALICPTDAITVEPTAKIDEALCLDCFACVNQCPEGALLMPEPKTAPTEGRPYPPPRPQPGLRNQADPAEPRAQPGFAQGNRGGLLGQIFDFFGRQPGSGRGRGMGGGRGGHGKGRRGW